jgi:hypothetical protein
MSEWLNKDIIKMKQWRKILISAHDAFIKADMFESQIIQKSLGARKPKDLNMIAKIG